MFLAPLFLTIGLNIVPAWPVSVAGGTAPAPNNALQGERATRLPGAESHGTVSLRWENDAVAGADRDYSNGLSLTVSMEGRGPLGGIWKWFGAKHGRWATSYELGQIISTPHDLTQRVPGSQERPYAGLLFGAVSTQYVSGQRFHGAKLIAGMVGPASLAEETQLAYHRMTGNPEPQGWDSQLENEPILNLVYEHRRRYRLADSSSGWAVEAIPVAGAMFGNVLIQAQADAQVRVGFNLPDDFGKRLIRGLGNVPIPGSGRGSTPSREFGAYLFAGGGANLVGRNLTLDGNTFRSGPRVDKKPLFPAAEVGVSFWTRWFEATLSYVYWGREYETQPEGARFGAATIAFRF